jgi:hypothetical protein
MSILLSLSNECLAMLFAVKYGVAIMRALRTFLIAALTATAAWTSTHAFERVDLIGGAGAVVAVAANATPSATQSQDADRGDRASRAGPRGFSR